MRTSCARVVLVAVHIIHSEAAASPFVVISPFAYLLTAPLASSSGIFPNLEAFATLSPIPGFRQWLEMRVRTRQQQQGQGGNGGSDGMAVIPLVAHASDEGAALLAADVELLGGGAADPDDALLRLLATGRGTDEKLAASEEDEQPQQRRHQQGLPWHEHEGATAALRPVLMRLGARYLAREKRRGRAVCPVANFHLRNGASAEKLNWLADGTARGLAQSAGLMVNYRYVLDHCAPNNEAYALHGAIDSSAMETALAAEEGVALPEEW